MAELPGASHTLIRALSGSYSALTGVGAALVGVGGAELRFPALAYMLRLPLRGVLLVNLMISIGTASLGIPLRFLLGGVPSGAISLGSVLMLASLPGAYLGGKVSLRTGERALRLVLLALLVVVLIRLFGGHEEDGEGPVETVSVLALTAAIGFGTALIGGLVGVAGGEYRIPALVFLVGYGFKDAGTMSLIASLPTVLAATVIHGREIPLDGASRNGLLWIGLPAIAAVVPGVLLLVQGPELYIRVAFAAIISFTILHLTLDLLPEQSRLKRARRSRPIEDTQAP
jgi:uncharacterized membrane protein YfcA